VPKEGVAIAPKFLEVLRRDERPTGRQAKEEAQKKF
jgi:hypothetical protein